MKRLLVGLIVLSMTISLHGAHASSDAQTIAAVETVANISGIGDIWTGSVPTQVQYEKTSTYPCGYVLIPIRGLLPYSKLADKANGVSLEMTAWSDAGAKVGNGYLTSSDWNPVGPVTQAKLFFCGADVVGTHTLLIETLYYTSTTGLLSRYLSTTNRSRINISIQKLPPATILDFKVSLPGQSISGSWSAPSSESVITGYEIGLFDSNLNAPIPPRDSDLKAPFSLAVVPASSRQVTIPWSDVAKLATFSGTSIVLKVRAQSNSGSGLWSNGIYLTQKQFEPYKPPSVLPPKPNFSAFVSPSDNSVITIQIGANDVVGYVNNYKVTGFITKIRRANGQDQIGRVGPISALTSYSATWTNSSSGNYEVAVALLNTLGQGDWSDYRLVVVPSQFVETSPSPTPSASPITKKSTITCLKGTLVKKVSGLNPKCPTGYKIKK